MLFCFNKFAGSPKPLFRVTLTIVALHSSSSSSSNNSSSSSSSSSNNSSSSSSSSSSLAYAYFFEGKDILGQISFGRC